jgi:hypothetical protein
LRFRPPFGFKVPPWFQLFVMPPASKSGGFFFCYRMTT